MKVSVRYGCVVHAASLVLFLSTISYAVSDTNTVPAKGWDSFIAATEKDLPQLPSQVLQGSKETYFRADNLTALLLAGGASIVMHNEPSKLSIDDKVASHFERHGNLPDDLSEATYTVGGPGFHFAATGLWYGLAAADKDDLNRQRAWTMLTALSITGATTLALKVAVNNEQPNQEMGYSWPSGHTASSFTVASVLDEFYGPQIGIPCYAAAGFVGYRMMDAGDHWASDVLFGGVLGWVVGHTVAGKHKQLEVAGFEVTPYFGDSGASGIALVRQF
jgi:hypothetical protein